MLLRWYPRKRPPIKHFLEGPPADSADVALAVGAGGGGGGTPPAAPKFC